MSRSLFATMFKNKAKTVISFTLGSIFYLSLVIWLYPSVADSEAFDTMFKELPEGLMSAFGFNEGINSLSGFVAGEYYGLLFIIILLIYCVTTATQLIVRLVDQGSMAYLLSSGLSRSKIAMTQIAVILLGLIFIIVVTTISGVVGADIFIEEDNFNAANFVELNIVTFLLFFVISSYCFLFSCLFNDEKKTLSIAGGLSFVFFAVDMVSKISDKLDWMQNFTIFSTFKATEIAQGTVNIIPICIGLGVAGIILYSVAVFIFNKRDLPL
ncbi:ABC transporter permease subunit [Virgibacillus litoralis]|uniref:ABC-2 type transport system permease protein n=1 Tax=Virgibacillus litoralis TaxID=578221 RepID=A0ABS4HCM4_9BACI|nr:ABC transporter permease subunit [Virgibacillus litoralis]MBP1948469.1 ABC-2 type transport system permease protein [Virgibacillus litoralis]